MLVLNFPTAAGEALIRSRSHCFRFCADGTLRGADNAIAAVRAQDSWRLGRRLARDIECTGPVLVQARRMRTTTAASSGPFDQLIITAGLLHADGVCLPIILPHWGRTSGEAWYELMLLPVPMDHHYPVHHESSS